MAKSKRKQGEGLLRKRADGRWEARLVVDYNDGLPVTKNVTAKTKAACKEKLEKLKQELGCRPKKVSDQMLFGEWINYWYQTYCKPALRPTTQANYESRIKMHVLPSAISKIKLCELIQRDIQALCNHLRKHGRTRYINIYGEGLSERTVRECYMLCHASLDKAVKEKLILRNPCDGFTPPKKCAREINILSHDEIERILIQAKAEGYFEILLLDLSTGLRRGELCGLKWSDLNLRTGELHICRQVVNLGKHPDSVCKPKTKAAIRTIILPPDLVNILAEYKQGCTIDSEWIFPSPVLPDKPRCSDNFHNILQRILEHSNCKHVRFHDLRHTFASLALENGMDIKTLSTIIGHVSASTTIDIYAHITDTMQRNAATRINQAIGGSNEEAPVLEEEPLMAYSKPSATKQAEFTPYTPKIRKSGTGCIYQVNDSLWEGSFSPRLPNGKRHKYNTYAKTREECEKALAEMIVKIKAEIRIEREKLARA